MHSKDSFSGDGTDSGNPENPNPATALVCALTSDIITDDIHDVSGKSLEFSLLEDADESVEGLYLYKNSFNLLPRTLCRLGNLRTLKFFANEVNIFPAEFEKLIELECLQIKVSSPGFSSLPLHKLEALKELDLSKVPPRTTDFPILNDISKLQCLTKLSVCHFSLRYLPPEIGFLNNLEYLDLSFNKMKFLPIEISYLKALVSLNVANNKLLELPSGLSSLKMLEYLDLSYNRLTSLESLELASMPKLQKLNIQYNKLLGGCQIPLSIQCNLEGNDKEISQEEFSSSAVEMDVLQASTEEVGNGSPNSSSGQMNGTSLSSRCFVSRKAGKESKQRYSLQQRARQERLNNSRKCKNEDHAKVSTSKSSENCESCTLAAVTSESLAEAASSGTSGLSDNCSQLLHKEAGPGSCVICVEDEVITPERGSANCSCTTDSVAITEEDKNECQERDCIASASETDTASEGDDSTTSEVLKSAAKSKRHFDGDLDNPKPSKFRRPTDGHSNLSCKYSNLSFCGIEDHLPDGFYDAGRDRPFMPLRSYEENLPADSREVILLDRERDEELDAISLSAQTFVYQWKKLNGLLKGRKESAVETLQIASLLSLFVSDHFGGRDRSAAIEKARKSVSGSNYQKPFVCTCPTGNNNSMSAGQDLDHVQDIPLRVLCEESLRSIKARRNSIVVPIGTLHFGVCRHRALLLKYLCDRMEPPVPCELVRGYLDFLPHAWNTVLIKKGDQWVRMVVDACRPYDIREETDPEYFCRYVPLSRINAPLSVTSDSTPDFSFPSFSACDNIGNAPSVSLMRCKYGSVEVAAKVRTFEVSDSAAEAIKNFEFSCLGEIRIMASLKHSCIVEFFGHRISSKWTPSSDGNSECRLIQSVIFMEYMKGGSLKSYINELSKAGNKHLSVELAFYIARDVSSALMELHAKHIIHRDIKSENILIDLDMEQNDGIPVVKLCDFDRAVPLRSSLHTCCIAHVGIPPPDVCVGTPRWMAPEVLRAMHDRKAYGLEVDIWSFGCLLFELLTLDVPYSDLPEQNIHDLLQMGERPPLPNELAMLEPVKEPISGQSSCSELDVSQTDLDNLRFLVDLYRRCTEGNPADRPTAEYLYEVLQTRASKFTSSKS